jgi:hypothetical protein
MSNIHTFSNGVKVLNCTPHPITFQETDGSVVSIPVARVLNSATTHTIAGFSSKTHCAVAICDTTASQNEEDLKWMKEFLSDNPEVFLVGSAFAVKAYPDMVYGMISVPGYERVAPAEKRMRIDAFYRS